MRLKQILPWSKDLSKVKALYFAAFSPEDRLSFRKMSALTLLRPASRLMGLFENDELCGFAFTICSKKYLYVNFMAIDPAYRSHGYGRHLIDLLRRRYQLPIIVLVKLPVFDTPDYEYDVRRIRFWQSTGCNFFHNAYVFTDPNGAYFAVGVIGGDYDRDAFQEILDLRSFHPAAFLRSLKRVFRL